MLLEDVIEEYLYHCLVKGFTDKTMKNKRQDYKQLLQFLKEKRAVTELESITVYDLKDRLLFRVLMQMGMKPSQKKINQMMQAMKSK
ncbi:MULTISPECIES: YneF family protein [Neobacillus]|nr:MULTISPECIES: YneF family protein [Neobacillus]